MYSVGDYAINTIKKRKIQVLEHFELWGYVSYKVFDAESDDIYTISAEQLSPFESDEIYEEAYLRYVTLLEKIKDEAQNGIVSKLSNDVIPLPHQLHVLNRVMSKNNVRYILADEVGLGKTIEAGLVMKELKARGLVKRVLIVAPTGLVTQWNQEMQEKFGETFHVILPEDYDTIRKITDNDDVYGQFSHVISPMDSIKPLERRSGWTAEKIEKYNEERIYSIINSDWDLIIVDEAHRMAGSSGEVARYKLGKMLSEASPFLLLLTATPHNGKTEPFLRLIRLLDEKAFPNMNAVVKEQVAPYVIRTEKRDAIDNNGNKLFKKRSTQLVELHWDEKHSMQKELYEKVTEYVSKNYNKAMRARGKNMWLVFLLVMMQRLVSSSTAAILGSMERRMEILTDQEMQYRTMTQEEFAELVLEENMEEAIEALSLDAKSELNDLDVIIAVAKQAKYQYSDVKIEPLLEILERLFQQQKSEKAIIFTEFVATQGYIKELLEKQGYTISLLNGSMSIDERNLKLHEFREQTDILISTDAGGEGLNLQFCNCVINYDLPWNPMKIEQRIGRVDRIGQQKDVEIFNFILGDTVENRVRNVLEEKLNIILEEVGIDKYSDVLDNEATEVNYTEAYMNSIRDPKYIAVNVAPIEEDLKKQVKQSANIRELISEAKDLTELVGQESSFDMEKALRQMITNYAFYKNNPFLQFEEYSIYDDGIQEHLKKKLKQDKSAIPMRVSIDNFPNEQGFFMLWQLNVSSKEHREKIIPVFINKDSILRPLAGKRIWDALCDEGKIINVKKGIKIEEDRYEKLQFASREYTYNEFLEMKKLQEEGNEETYQKYSYALKIRIEAAKHIGIENIRKHKLQYLNEEMMKTEEEYQLGKVVCPELQLVLLVEME